MEIPIVSLEGDRVKITCYDEDVMMDDFVGEEEFSVSELCSMGAGFKKWYTLKFEGKKSAEISLSAMWVPKT